MIVALIDNGSLEPAAQRNLRRIAAALSTHTGVPVRPVSWMHSDRIPEHDLEGIPSWTLEAFMRSFVALGQREFVFVPFFISAQGAIGSALRRDLETLQRTIGGFEFTFSEGLAERGVLPTIVADRVRTCSAAHGLESPAVILVDHGGPSATSAALRDQLAGATRKILGNYACVVAASSMEGAHPPLLANLLQQREFAVQQVVVAPLFLSPGRHAGPGGDIDQICRTAHPRCHVTDLVGTHPLAINALADALCTTLSTVHAHSFA